MPAASEPIDIAIGLHQAGHLWEAEDIYRQILTKDPSNVSAWNLLGVVATQLNQYSAALQCLERALRLKADSAEIHYNVGVALQGLEKIDEAIISYRQALKYDLNHAQAHNNLGAALKDKGQFPEAMACIRQALLLDPTMAQAHSNLGNAFHAQSHWDEALQCFEKAIAFKPDFADAHTHRAMILLACGDFQQGWPEFEWRWKSGQLPLRQFHQPQWNGRTLHGQNILLRSEQGLGDTLLFIRYAPLVKALGAKVIVECPQALMRLLASCSGIDQLVACGEELPPFDAHAPLLSLPTQFKTTLDTVPAQVPYLSADQGLVAHWLERLSGLRGLKIGINWRGRSGHGLFRLRDIPPSLFASLSGLPLSLVILQQGATEQELAELSAGLPIFHPGDDFDRTNGAFMDTAAIMKNLDLVITSDTSVPHLAGALSVPVWIALPHVAGWQWLRDRPDTPWYPTARLFRQKTPGDWNGVFHEIRSALAGLVR